MTVLVCLERACAGFVGKIRVFARECVHVCGGEGVLRGTVYVCLERVCAVFVGEIRVFARERVRVCGGEKGVCAGLFTFVLRGCVRCLWGR